MKIEKVILKNLLENENFINYTIPYIQEDYFSDLREKSIFGMVRDYHAKYSKRPTKTELLLETDSLKINSDLHGKVKEIIEEVFNAVEPVNYEWLIENTEKFCREKAVYLAMVKSMEILEGKDKKNTETAIPDLLSKALAVSFDNNIGHDYLEDYEKQYDYYHKATNNLACDIDKFNIITNGGIPEKTLSVILAGVHVGKTLSMCHLAASYLNQGKNILYITLEVSQEEINRRIDANLMDIDIKTIRDLSREDYIRLSKGLAARKKTGKLIVKEYPTSSANSLHFRALLDELALKKGFRPDAIMVDYLNICTSARFRNGGAGMYEYVKSIAEELRGLAVEYKTRIITATQVNREGFKSSEPDMTNTSESFGTNAVADFILAIVTNDDLMKLGQAKVSQLKNRFGDKNLYSKFLIGVDRQKMRLYNVKDDNTIVNTGSTQLPETSTNRFDKYRSINVQ